MHFQWITCAALLSKHFLCQDLELWIKRHSLVCVRWCHWRTLVCQCNPYVGYGPLVQVALCQCDPVSDMVPCCRLVHVGLTQGSDMVHCRFVDWLPSRGMSDDVNTVVYQTWPWRKEVYHLDLWAFASACWAPRVGEGGLTRLNR